MLDAFHIILCSLVVIVLLKETYSKGYERRVYQIKTDGNTESESVEGKSEEIDKPDVPPPQFKQIEGKSAGVSVSLTEIFIGEDCAFGTLDKDKQKQIVPNYSFFREHDECTEELVQYSWQINFNYFDLNHDKIIDERDMAVQQNVFDNVYNLSGCEGDSIKRRIYEFWSCLTFNGLERGLSNEKFVTQITQSYKLNKAWTKTHIRKCTDGIVGVLDHNKNGHLSMDELAVYFKSVNMGNRKLIERRYKMMCPDTLKCCTLENAAAAGTATLIGDDDEMFEAIMDDYNEFGIYLDEFEK